MLTLLAIDVPLAFVPRWGPVAAMLIPIWVGGAILTRYGWGLLYAAILVAGTIGMVSGVPPNAVLGALTAITLLMCRTEIRSSAGPVA